MEKKSNSPFTAGNQWRFPANNDAKKPTSKKTIKMLEQLFTFDEREIMHVISDEKSPLVVRHCASMIFEKENMIQAVMFMSELKEVVYGNTKDAKETKE